jgi:DNA-binding transcriptional ArsR family regulator
LINTFFARYLLPNKHLVSPEIFRPIAAARQTADGEHASRAALICKWQLAYSGGVVDAFRALDDETRRLVLDELVARDGQTLFEICTVLAMRHGRSLTRQAISQHLGVLESAGLIATERRGRSKFHYFKREPLVEITERWPVRERTDQ